jgi:hypothetical protein
VQQIEQRLAQLETQQRRAWVVASLTIVRAIIWIAHLFKP